MTFHKKTANLPKMRKFISLLGLCLLCLGCVDEIRRPVASGLPEEENSENLMVANLPVHIDSTNYLIHPVGQIEVREGGYYGSNNSSSGSAHVGDQFFGNFSNLRFQEINSEEFTDLTNETLRIHSVSFLREIFENTDKQLLLYRILDTDTNADGELNSQDREALYISKIDGSGLKKVSPTEQVVLEAQILDEMNRLYFRTFEDTDANGRLDLQEKPHNYYVDLASEELKATEYFPLKERG